MSLNLLLKITLSPKLKDKVYWYILIINMKIVAKKIWERATSMLPQKPLNIEKPS